MRSLRSSRSKTSAPSCDAVVLAQLLAHAVDVDLEGRAHVAGQADDGPGHGVIISARARDDAPHRARSCACSTSDVGALPPLVHAVDPARPGARRGLLRLRRVDLGRLLRHARRPHRDLRRGRGASPPPPRAPTARCSRSTARAARTGSCCARWPSSAPTRSCSSRATSTTRSSTRSRPSGWTSASCRRPTSRASRPLLPPSVDDVLDGAARATRRRSRSSTRARPTRASPPTRARSSRAVHAASDHAMVIVDEAWGGHLRFHPDLPESAMGAGADICVQSTHKLAGGLQQTGLIHWHDRARRLRAHGGGLPRVRHHLAELPPAGQRRRRRAHAGRARRGRSSAARSSARASSRRPCTRALPDLDRMDDPAWIAELRRPHRRLRPRQDDRRPQPLRPQRLRRGAGARRARDRDREGRRAHDHAHHDLPARPRRGARDGRRRCTTSSPATACRATRASRCRPTRSARSTTGR